MPDIVETELQISLQLEALVREWRDAVIEAGERNWIDSERWETAENTLLAFAKANL